MKSLLIFPLLVLLTGCVTYYTPETVTDDGVYYAVDEQPIVDDLYSYDSYTVYPWGSLDYFYLGHRPYGYGHDYGYGHGFGYGYGMHGGFGYGGFYLGTSFGYSPWDYPYYGHHSPWFGSYRSHNYRPHYRGWRPYRGNCSRGHRCGHRGNGGHSRDRGQERFSGRDQNDRPRRDRDDGNGNNGNRGRRPAAGDHTGDRDTASVTRYVSTAPSGSAGNRGMVIRKRETTKIGKSRIEPAHTTPRQPVTTRPVVRDSATSDNRSRRGSGEIRNRGRARQNRSRTEPVNSVPPSGVGGNVAITTRTGRPAASRPVTSVKHSSRGAGEVRYRASAKPGRSRTEPVKPVSSSGGRGKPAAKQTARKSPRSVSRSPSRSKSKASSGKSARSQSGTKSSGSRQTQRNSRSGKKHGRQ